MRRWENDMMEYRGAAYKTVPAEETWQILPGGENEMKENRGTILFFCPPGHQASLKTNKPWKHFTRQGIKVTMWI
jgi:hypothetical protein